MPPRLFFVRHGEAEHNVRKGKFRDSWLTENGKRQCLSLRDTFAHQNDVSLVVSSPLRRAIQTAAYTFSPALRKEEVPFVLLPEAQELDAHACDIGHEREELVQQLLAEKLFTAKEVGFEVDKVDMIYMVDGWNSKKEGKWGTEKRVFEKRAARLRTWLYKRQEECVVVVTHGGFLHALTEDWTGFGKYSGTGWANCEIKEFRFTAESVAADAHVEQTGSIPSVTAPKKKESAVVGEPEDIGSKKKEEIKPRGLLMADAVRWTLEAIEKEEEEARSKAAAGATATTSDEVEKTVATTADEVKETATAKGKKKVRSKMTRRAIRGVKKPRKAAEKEKSKLTTEMLRKAAEEHEKETAASAKEDEPKGEMVEAKKIERKVGGPVKNG